MNPEITTGLGNGELKAHTIGGRPAVDVALDTLNSFVASEAERSRRRFERISFGDYLSKVCAAPDLLIRNGAQYVCAALECLGVRDEMRLGREIRIFEIAKRPFQSEHVSAPERVYGQDVALFKLYSAIKEYERAPYPRRMFFLHGPWGSGKTSLVRTLLSAVEYYSAHDDRGVRYRPVFVLDEKARRSIPAFSHHQQVSGSDEAGVVIRPIMNPDPIFLLPNSAPLGKKTERVKFFEQLRDSGAIGGDFNKDYLLLGDLDSGTRQIFNALLRYCDHNVREVLERFVRVERWEMSSREGDGLARIESSYDRSITKTPLYPHVAAGVHPLSDPIPEALRSESGRISFVEGVLPRTNRGMIAFSDLFRTQEHERPDELARLNFLLNPVEQGILNVLSPDRTEVAEEPANILFLADGNDADVTQKMANRTSWGAWQRRITFVGAPFIRTYLDEADAHRDRISSVIGEGSKLTPGALEIFALFVTATRLLKPRAESYAQTDSTLAGIVEKFSTVQKALLLQVGSGRGDLFDINFARPQNQELPEARLRVLERNTARVAEEYMKGVGIVNFSMYDGGFGISTSEAEDLLKQVVQLRHGRDLTVVDICIGLGKFLGRLRHDFEVAARKEALGTHFAEEELAALARAPQPAPGPQKPSSSQSQGGGSLQEIALRQARKRVEQEFPVESTAEILGVVTEYARRKFQNQCSEALGITVKADIDFEILKYLEHVKASLVPNQFTVREKFRASGFERNSTAHEADEDFLRGFEQKVMDPGQFRPNNLVPFRERLLNQAKQWVEKNMGKPVETHVGEIFGDIHERLAKHIAQDSEKKLLTFASCAPRYSQSKGALADDEKIPGLKDQIKDYKNAEQKLIEFGYPLETLALHIEWAFGERLRKVGR